MSYIHTEVAATSHYRNWGGVNSDRDSYQYFAQPLGFLSPLTRYRGSKLPNHSPCAIHILSLPTFTSWSRLSGVKFNCTCIHTPHKHSKQGHRAGRMICVWFFNLLLLFKGICRLLGGWNWGANVAHSILLHWRYLSSPSFHSSRIVFRLLYSLTDQRCLFSRVLLVYRSRIVSSTTLVIRPITLLEATCIFPTTQTLVRTD